MYGVEFADQSNWHSCFKKNHDCTSPLQPANVREGCFYDEVIRLAGGRERNAYGSGLLV